jgi:hypothetical protein
MQGNLKPAETTTAPVEILPYEPEPDVTWGVGGIDDWGWTRLEPPAPLERSAAGRTAA